MKNESNSIEQQAAEKIIFQKVEQILQVSLEANPKIYLSGNITYIQPDFYSENPNIVGEIFSHIGKSKKSQDNKIANDILKLLLLEKKTGKVFEKYLVVCDEEEERKLNGKSALAESIRTFGVKVVRVEIDENEREVLIKAQERQKMVNGVCQVKCVSPHFLLSLAA